MRGYLIYGGVAVAAWLLLTRRMTKEEAARSQTSRFVKNVVSLAVAGGCVWFAWWVLSTRCNGGC
jgi:hypothetical protein